MKHYLGCLGLCAVLLLGGCLDEANRPDEAAKLAQQMHTAIQKQDWDAIMPLYGDKFFVEQSRKEWLDKLASLHERFGALRDVKPVFAQKDPRLGGDFYVYGFRMMFERGVVHETLTVFEKNGENRLRVTGQLFKFKDEVL